MADTPTSDGTSAASGAEPDLTAVIRDPGLQRIYGYWKAKRGTRRCPARRDIDPVEIGYMLGWIMLIDVSYEPLQFRFRLYGTELASRMGFDMTGKYLHEHPQPEFRAYLERSWRDVLDRGTPTHNIFNRPVDDRNVRFESLRMPLSSDGTTIDMLMVAAHRLD